MKPPPSNSAPKPAPSSQPITIMSSPISIPSSAAPLPSSIPKEPRAMDLARRQSLSHTPPRGSFANPILVNSAEQDRPPRRPKGDRYIPDYSVKNSEKPGLSAAKVSEKADLFPIKKEAELETFAVRIGDKPDLFLIIKQSPGGLIEKKLYKNNRYPQARPVSPSPRRRRSRSPPQSRKFAYRSRSPAVNRKRSRSRSPLRIYKSSSPRSRRFRSPTPQPPQPFGFGRLSRSPPRQSGDFMNRQDLQLLDFHRATKNSNSELASNSSKPVYSVPNSPMSNVSRRTNNPKPIRPFIFGGMSDANATPLNIQPRAAPKTKLDILNDLVDEKMEELRHGLPMRDYTDKEMNAPEPTDELCFNCCSVGHSFMDCTVVCVRCGESGHKAYLCEFQDSFTTGDKEY